MLQASDLSFIRSAHFLWTPNISLVFSLSFVVGVFLELVVRSSLVQVCGGRLIGAFAEMTDTVGTPVLARI